MEEKEKGFKINGKVICKESKEGIAGLTIEALDKDLIFDERLYKRAYLLLKDFVKSGKM
jgi:hypothetical protein